MNVVPSMGAGSPLRSPGIPWFPITGPTGSEILIPPSADEDHPYFTPDEHAAIRDYYQENGYVVVRSLVPAEFCRSAMMNFKTEVKSFPGFIYRQATANPERHVFTPNGFMLNPILNVQSLDPRHFERFRADGLSIMTHPRMQAAVRTILREPGKIVQSMYFEGNPGTWAHQDSYYLDAEEIGRMAGAWIAVEDIAPGAGRFFIYPGSHRLDVARNSGDVDIAFNHDRYKRFVTDYIRTHGLQCRSPALRQGDVLFWSSKTLHGSLDTTQPQFSRSSFTAHYIPDSQRLLQFQARIRKLQLSHVNGMRVHKPKDLGRCSRRAVFWIETSFPKTFRAAKKIAIKAHTG